MGFGFREISCLSGLESPSCAPGGRSFKKEAGERGEISKSFRLELDGRAGDPLDASPSVFHRP